MKDMGKKKKIDWKPGVLLAAAISFLLFLYAPIDLYCSNMEEFWFDFGVLFRMAGVLFLLSFLVLTAAYLIAALLHPVLYRIALAAGLFVLIVTYVQGNFLVKHLPPLDGTTILWEEYPELRTESLILCSVALCAVILMYILLKKQRFGQVIMYLSGCLTLMLLVTGVSEIFTNHALDSKLQQQVSTKNEFTMSQSENFVIFLLDAADSREFSYLLEQNPEYAQTFADFTYFENTVGAYSCTKYSIPYILSGEWFENETNFETYMEGVYAEDSPLFHELEERGYRIGLYEAEMNAQNNDVLRFDNIFEVGFHVRSYTALTKQELKLIGFRYAPYWLKKYCTLKRAGFDEQLQAGEGSWNGTFTGGNCNFLENLEKEGVTVDDTEHSFKFIHLEGAHSPFVYDAEVNEIDPSQGSYTQNMQASLTLATRYLEELKKSGAYDNTAIIVMSDHGFNEDIDGVDTGDNIFMRQCGLLLIKGVGETHDTMQTSNAPISYEDLQQAYVRLLDGAESDTVFDWQEGDERDRRYLWYKFANDKHIVEYLQTGYAWDLDTMIPTGREFDQ